MKQPKKRLCLFAGFDKNGEIADYVVYYLKALSKIADVYYWGDFEAANSEKAKIAPYCKDIYCERHGKYDFGSWQELIAKIGREKISSYDELILANDSCYGPLFDLSNLFQEMDAKPCDFWGLSSAYNNHLHLQSYFLVLKQPAIRSDVFYNFFDQVKPEDNYCDVCAMYEDRFTYILSKAGFHFCSYIEYGDLMNHPYYDIVSAIQNRHFPFLKVKFFLGDIRDQGGVKNWRKVVQQFTDYPTNLIDEDLTRRGYDLDEIDKAVREKQSETPDFYNHNLTLKRRIRKIAKSILRPVKHVIDSYIHGRIMPYLMKVDHIDRSCRNLQQKYDELMLRLDPEYKPKSFKLQESSQKCALNLANMDASAIKRLDLELPLTDESHVLLIGNIMPNNLALLGLYDPYAIFLNNNWGKELKIKSLTTHNLCDFNFIDETGQKVYFDFILAQPFDTDVSDKDLRTFVENLKRQMLSESVLVLFVPNDERQKYEQILQSSDFHPAISERGLVVYRDPFQTYYDKIKSIKGYKALIYKLK